MPILYLDIETDGLDPYTCNVVTVQVLTASGRRKLIKDPENLTPLKSLLENNLIVGQNIKFDSKFLRHQFGITLYNVYDTYIAEIAISGGLLAGRKGASLQDLALRYCGMRLDKSSRCTFQKGVLLTSEQIEYALDDVMCLPGIYMQQLAKIRLLGLENVIATEMKAIPAVVWLELSGIHADLNRVAEIRKRLVEQKEAAEHQLRAAFQNDLMNLNSTKQLQKELQKLGIECHSTSEEVLSKFNHPVTNTLKEYKEASKLLSTFVEKTPEYINPVTGRIHSNFSQYGAKSGRFTSSKPNLQQQPSKFSEWRTVYRAEFGNKLIVADYSQIELRILAQVSRDHDFIQGYLEGIDLHKMTASKIFKIQIDQVTKEQRNIAKTINFGTAYGMWTRGLISNLTKAGISISDTEAESMIRDFYKSYPGVSKYLRDTSEEGLRKLEVRNIAGRLMRFSRPEDEREKGSIKRESKNLPIQSLCADMIKTAMGNLFLKLEPMGVKFVNTIHDELVFECPEALAQEVSEIVKSEMEAAGSLYLKDVPCVAEVTVSDFWEK